MRYQPDGVVVLGGHAPRTSLVKMVLNTLFATFGLPYRFSPPEFSGPSEASQMWPRVLALMGGYHPQVHLVEDLVTSEENDAVFLLALPGESVGEVTVVCGQSWKFPVGAVHRFLFRRYWPDGPKPKLVGLPYRSTLAERLILGLVRGLIYRIFPWACLGQMRRHVIDQLEELRKHPSQA
jgi:hypothetical protein